MQIICNGVKDAVEKAFELHRRGEFDQAASVYDQILGQISAPDPNVFFGYGTLLISQQKYGLGIALLQAAVQSAPDCAAIWTNLGCAYKHISQDNSALSCYEKALALEPQQPDILAGLAGFWVNKNQSQKVVDYGRLALELKPDHDAAHMHLALGLMEQGKYEEAWPHYEHRWETLERVNDKRPYKAPMWDGKFVNTLAIHGEQGLGDEILFMSLFYKVRGLAENIVIECAERLIPVFTEAFGLPCYKDHAALISAHGEPDAYISMASLPKFVGLPDGRPFLKRHYTGNRQRPKVGIAWKGGTLRTNIKQRTIPKEMLDPILAISGIDFIDVQYGYGDGFDTLQAKIADCDLVISVCQTAVHQAGAMGVDCWVLVPEHAAWRYCGKDMMPWYRSVRFFKQQNGEWQSAIELVAATLRERYVSLAA